MVASIDAAWIVTRCDDGYEARQHTMSATGGEWVGEALRAATLAELRRLMPMGCEVGGRAPGDRDGIVEIWWQARASTGCLGHLAKSYPGRRAQSDYQAIRLKDC